METEEEELAACARGGAPHEGHNDLLSITCGMLTTVSLRLASDERSGTDSIIVYHVSSVVLNVSLVTGFLLCSSADLDTAAAKEGCLHHRFNQLMPFL